MRLKRVRIFGFKTFADRTDLVIDSDLIAIVGPNGCGKSNIVDAILWGLGEPNARHLRAATNQDVIFNGSAKRKPLGYAEVTLVFDNESGSLPIPSAEVSISRRISRSGESHFSINKRSCRLKDVYDLMADSGLGRSGYAIVGQREIDQALSAGAEERRSWIDEVAGVQRFRAKRQDSLKRMKDAEDHLARLNAMLADLEAQREPLREESEIAEQFVRCRDALVQIESGLLIREVCKYTDEIQELTSKLSEALVSTDSMVAEMQGMEREQRELGDQIAELERKMDALRELRQAQLTATERAGHGVRLAQQKLESLQELESSLSGEIAQSAERLQEAETAVQLAKKEWEEESTAHQQWLNECAGTADIAKQIRTELANLEASIQSAQAAHSARMRAEAERDQAQRRLQEIAAELDGIAKTMPDLSEARDYALGAQSTSQAELDAKVAELQTLEASVESHRQALAQQEEKRRKLLAELATMDGRRRGIEATLDAHEGLGQGASAVMGLVRSGKLPDRYRPVAEVLTSQVEHALAIETALGGAAHDLIVPHDSDAKAAIQILKENRLGRATFQPINLIRPSYKNQDLLQVSKRPGVVGIAAELVECDEEFRPVVDSLLGRVLIVETLDAGLAIAKTSGWSRLVSLDGEVIHSAGAVTGGRTNRQSSGIVQRNAELAELLNHIEAAQEELERMSGKFDQASADIDQKLQDSAALGSAIKELKAQFEADEAYTKKIEEEIASSEREQQRLQREKERLEELSSSELPATVDLTELAAQRDELLSQVARQNADQESMRDRLSDLEMRVERSRSKLKEAEARLARLNVAESTSEKRLGNLEKERAELAAVIAQETERMEASNAKAEQCAAELHEVSTERAALVEVNLALTKKLQDLQQHQRTMADAMRSHEIERARHESKKANAVQRLTEEYGLSEEDALSQREQVDVPEDAGQIVSTLRRELRSLGNPNLGSIEAYRRVNERFTELGAQLQDLDASRKEIEAAITELDRLTRDRFLDAFAQVQTEFCSVFANLFGGGEAALKLSDTLNPLMSGVELEVTLPGKKRQRLELLSGGERSLCACAFLFALLRVKPSPLVILDEVDAPLDGRNVERYIDVLKSFAGKTQFLVITHNPVTIESAPLWFGVTMREPGVTTILPFQAPDEQEKELVQAVVHDSFLVSN